MSSKQDEKCEKSTISLSTGIALALLGISIYQLGPEVVKYGKRLWVNTSCRLNPPRGHLKPLGQQYAPVLTAQELTEFPTPEVFFKEYVSTAKPVIFRGAAKIIPAFYRWTDEYLRKKYGHEEVAVEEGLKQKDTSSDHLHLSVISEFLNGYKDKEIYLVDTVSPARFADVELPRSIRCGNFQRALSDVIMWLSNGGTKSVIHRDYVDNLNCILEGEKKLHLFDKAYVKKRNKEFLSSSKVDVDAVDLCKNPSYATVPRYEIVVKTGDCLFLPFQMYHYVEASKQRNLGINFWFQHLNWFNATDCETKDTETDFHFGAHDMPTEAQLNHYFYLAGLEGQEPFDFKWFDKEIGRAFRVNKENITKLFNDADTNDNGELTLQELYQVEPNHFVSFFSEKTNKGYLNYTRERGNLDPENPETTKNV